MEGISDLKIIGIDELRPPIIRKEPYIDIFFKLSHQAPLEWCKDLNALLSKNISSASIEEKKGLFINTWVRSSGEIPELFNELKTAITECTRLYIERITLASQESLNNDSQAVDDTGEQGQLNRIIASLDFIKDKE